MTSKLPLPQLREQAIALRRAGKSRREIQETLQIRSNGTLNEILRGEPPQPWTRRPNAKDDVRTKARKLREQGLALPADRRRARRLQELGLTVGARPAPPRAAELRGVRQAQR